MKVSLIIPVYNVEIYLKKCLDSILRQTYKDYEVICINDGSTDSSLTILQDYKSKYKNFSVYTISNSGQANARNLGVKYAKGEFVCFLDSDDFISDNLLERLVDTQERDNCDMVICGIDRIFEEAIPIFERVFKYDAKLEERRCVSIYDYPKLITVINNSPFSKLIRKSIILENDIAFPTGYIYEDLAFTHTLLATGLTVSIIQDKLYKYIIHKGSTMTSKNSHINDIFPIFEIVLNNYKTRGIYEEFKSEIDYLALYHIGIGTSYRLLRSEKCSVFQAIKKCKNYLRNVSCEKHNKYMVKKSVIERMFVKLFM